MLIKMLEPLEKDAKHEASFLTWVTGPDGSEPHNGDGVGGIRSTAQGIPAEGGGHQHPDSAGRSCRRHAAHKAEGGQLCVRPRQPQGSGSMGGPQGLRVRPGTCRIGPLAHHSGQVQQPHLWGRGGSSGALGARG